MNNESVQTETLTKNATNANLDNEVNVKKSKRKPRVLYSAPNDENADDEDTSDENIEWVPYKSGQRMNKKDKIELLKKIFKWDIAELLGNSRFPVSETMRYLRNEYHQNVPYSTLHRLMSSWVCEYDENHEIKRIYEKAKDERTQKKTRKNKL